MADDQTGATLGGAGSFREALLVEARRHLAEAWVAYAIVNSMLSATPHAIIMGRSRAEAVAAFLDFLETRAGAAVEDRLSYISCDSRCLGDDLVDVIDGFFVGGSAWLSALPEGPPTQHFVSELRPPRTKSAGKA